MELTILIAAVAAFGLPCSNPELRDYPAEELPWPAAYIRSIEGHNIIALRRKDCPKGGAISLEPGGQLELSGAPLD